MAPPSWLDDARRRRPRGSGPGLVLGLGRGLLDRFLGFVGGVIDRRSGLGLGLFHLGGDLGETILEIALQLPEALLEMRAKRLEVALLEIAADELELGSEIPEMIPPPPMGTTTALRSSTCSTSSRPMVPCPAMTASSSKAWTRVIPSSSAIR